MRNVIDQYPDPGRHTVSHMSQDTQSKYKEPAFKFVNYGSQLKIGIRNQNDLIRPIKGSSYTYGAAMELNT